MKTTRVLVNLGGLLGLSMALTSIAEPPPRPNRARRSCRAQHTSPGSTRSARSARKGRARGRAGPRNVQAGR